MITNGYSIENEYFKWMKDIVYKGKSGAFSFEKLLETLYYTEFKPKLKMDNNRVSDGLYLRHRFSNHYDEVEDAELYLTEPCSILEMMIALAIRCEENIMDDPEYGDRTAQWFWRMVVSLGLGSMRDDNYDKDYVDFVLDRFIKRKYEPNGKGGLFTIRNCDKDLRKAEIWYQLNWYLDSIV